MATAQDISEPATHPTHRLAWHLVERSESGALLHERDFHNERAFPNWATATDLAAAIFGMLENLPDGTVTGVTCTQLETGFHIDIERTLLPAEVAETHVLMENGRKATSTQFRYRLAAAK